MKFPLILLLTIFCSVLAQAASPAETLAQMEAAVVNEDAETAQKLWKQLTPDFDELSTADQARYLVVQGLIQEDILRDIDSAEQSFNRPSACSTRSRTRAGAGRCLLRARRTSSTSAPTTRRCTVPDREKAVALTRQLNTPGKLPKYMTALSFCYTDSPKRFQQGLVVLNEAMTLAEIHAVRPPGSRLDLQRHRPPVSQEPALCAGA